VVLSRGSPSKDVDSDRRQIVVRDEGSRRQRVWHRGCSNIFLAALGTFHPGRSGLE